MDDALRLQPELDPGLPTGSVRNPSDPVASNAGRRGGRGADRPHEVRRLEEPVQFGTGQQPSLQDELGDRPSSAQGLGRHRRGLLIADRRREGGDQPDGRLSRLSWNLRWRSPT
jgi:hypothetical protein